MKFFRRLADKKYYTHDPVFVQEMRIGYTNSISKLILKHDDEVNDAIGKLVLYDTTPVVLKIQKTKYAVEWTGDIEFSIGFEQLYDKMDCPKFLRDQVITTIKFLRAYHPKIYDVDYLIVMFDDYQVVIHNKPNQGDLLVSNKEVVGHSMKIDGIALMNAVTRVVHDRSTQNYEPLAYVFGIIMGVIIGIRTH